MSTTVAVPINLEQLVGGLGRAHWMGVGKVAEGAVSDWAVHEVEWDVLHDVGSHGGHHARIVTFMRDHGVDVVVAGHIGEPMQNTLTKLGVRIVMGAEGEPSAAALLGA